MKTSRKNMYYLFFSVVGLFVLACGGVGVPQETSTPVDTNTPVATNTNTPKPTKTPRPTSTPQPTPAPMGVAIQGDGFSFTVTSATALHRIYPGGEYLFSPNPGYMMIDLGVRLENDVPGKKVKLSWSDIYIEEANGEAWWPLWGSSEEVNAGTEIDPYTIGISSEEIKGTETTEFEGDLYLRLIFIVDDNKNNPVPIIFGIGESPVAEFIVEQPK